MTNLYAEEIEKMYGVPRNNQNQDISMNKDIRKHDIVKEE